MTSLKWRAMHAERVRVDRASCDTGSGTQVVQLAGTLSRGKLIQGNVCFVNELEVRVSFGYIRSYYVFFLCYELH